jgi:molybdopterin-biosynthesis enzyme MoeA-like protein
MKTCPVCGVWAELKETRKREGGIYRRYECGNLHTFGTMESVIAIYDEEFKRQNTAKKIARLQAVRDKKKEAI